MKLVFSKVHPNTKYSEIKLSHKGNEYYGKAIMNPEDKTPFSNYFGVHIAENRAKIQYWKEKRRINKIKEKAIKSLYTDLMSTLVTEDDLAKNKKINYIMNRIHSHIIYYHKEAEDNKANITCIQKSIEEMIKTRAKIFNSKKKDNF